MSKINDKDAKAFLDLYENNEVMMSSFGTKGRDLIVKLERDGIFHIKRLSRSSKQISLISQKAFDHVLSKSFNIPNLKAYVQLINNPNAQRADFAVEGISTKQKSSSPKSGLHISSFDNVEVTINGKSINLDMPEKCALFIHKDAEVKINENILIVGVENFDNITHALSQRNLFNSDKNILLAERSKYLQLWLSNISNQYLHFGDIDLAGIDIYQSSYLHIVKERGSFFIPNTIEEDLKKGTSKLYKQHALKYKNIKGVTPDIQQLIELIHANQKTIEQEYYILKK